jgi:hypothetical protein
MVLFIVLHQDTVMEVKKEQYAFHAFAVLLNPILKRLTNVLHHFDLLTMWLELLLWAVNVVVICPWIVM